MRELTARGHTATAMDLPCDEPGLGALEYAEAVEAAIVAAGSTADPAAGSTATSAEEPGPARTAPVVIVGHSLGGLTVPVVAQRLGPARVCAMVLVCALVPLPGSSFDDQVRADPGIMVEGFGTGQVRHDDRTTSWPADAAASNLYGGVVAELVAASSGLAAPSTATATATSTGLGDDVGGAEKRVTSAISRMRRQAWTIGREVTPLTAWPSIPITVVVCGDDRVVAPDRLRARARTIPGAELVELAGGHFPMLTCTGPLADIVVAAGGGG